jgi:hypothetical protein
MLKEAVVASFEILFQHLPLGTEKYITQHSQRPD